MPSEVGYYRHPTIHGDSIVFVCEDDLWSVPVQGGIARRLTANPGTVSFPSFSPDGTKIAFTGKDEGPLDVYVIDADGGPARRLTWLGGATAVAGWNPGGKEILFASDWRQPFRGFFHLHSVPVAGGSPRPLRLGPSRSISWQSDGPGVVIGRNSGDPARWKRYRGGTAGTIWIDRSGDGAFAPLIRLTGNLASPMWIGRRIYFLSDHEGFGNLYSCTPTGRDLRRHTHHEDFYVRFPSTDGARIVYHAGADLFVFDPEEEPVDQGRCPLAQPAPQRNRKFVPAATRSFEGFDLHPNGHSIAAVHRGRRVHDGALGRRGDPGAPEEPTASASGSPVGLPDGKRIVAVSRRGPAKRRSLVLSITGVPGSRAGSRATSAASSTSSPAPAGPERTRAHQPAAGADRSSI